MLLILSLTISLSQQNCGFIDYDTTILQYPHQYEVYPITQHQPYGVGFWTKYLAYDELNSDTIQIPYYSYEDPYFDNRYVQSVSGRQLLIIQESFSSYTEIIMILTLHSFDPTVTIHRLYYKQSGKPGATSYLDIQYNTELYEGYWIFTYIGFYPDAQLFEFITFGYAQYDSGWIWGGNKFIQNQQYEAILGGYGFYQVQQMEIFLSRFLGKFSKQIPIYDFFWDSDSLRNYLTNQQCYAQDQCQGLVYDGLIDLMVFDGTNDISFQKYVAGNAYFFSFWLKLNYEKVVRTSEMLVLRATTNSFYGNNTKMGDRSFYIKYLIDFPDNGTIMTLSTYHYSIPDINSQYTQENFAELQVSDKSWITQASQYWHKIKYLQQFFYGEQYVEFYYPQVEKQYFANLNDIYYRQFLNTMMYFYFGVDHYQYTQKLQGSIADFRLYTCIDGQNLDNVQRDCDDRCSSCSGPTPYDCKIDILGTQNQFVQMSNIYSPYYLSLRDQLFFDVYAIQNNQPLLCIGCLTICDENSEDCQISTNGLYIQCKSNYYFVNGECIECPNQCKSCDSNGDCLECFDSYYLNPIDTTCYECQVNCKSCTYSSETNQPICTSCYEKQSLYEGQCYNCGTLCSTCVFESFQRNDETVTFNRCLKCDEPGKHFRSIDGVNCQVNNIPSCLDAFQYRSQREQSLDYQFEPQAIDEAIQIICARCEYGFIYDPSLKSCFYHDPYQGKSYFLEVDTAQVILISGYPNSQLSEPQPYELLRECVLNGEPLQYCRYCIYSNTYKLRRCSLCDSGYYAERLRGTCLACEIKNCRICTQQMKAYEDADIWQIKAFYEYFINFNGQHSFDEYAQSQNEQDYEVVCTLCYEGYETINGKCVKKCHKFCKSCELVNDEYRCLQCFTNQQGQALTIVNNECIECPFNCALCTVRSDIDVHLINPYFQNSAYQYFSYLCLQPYSGMQNYYYDNLLGQYIKCDLYQSCFKSWTIERNIICKDSIYNQQYSSFQSTNEKEQYAFNNKKLSELFSNTKNISHLSEFENDFIYLQANQQGIKQIILRYYLDAQDGCVLQQNAYYAQYFSQNIFSAMQEYDHINRNINLELIGRNNPTLTFYGDFKLINFTSILISNITINSDNNINPIKFMEFSSLNRLFLQLINLQIIQIQGNTFSILCNNISSLNVTNTLFQIRIDNENSNNQQKYFIELQSSKSIDIEQDYIIFNQIKFNQCMFNQSEFIYYNSTLPLLLTNSSIYQSQFNQFTLFNISNANLTFQNIEMLEIIIQSCPNFISINQNTINLNNVSITDSQIENSVWLLAGYQVKISNITFNKLVISLNTILIELINSIKHIDFSLLYSNFSNIYYYNQSKLLRIQDNFQFSDSFVNFTQVLLENNTNPQRYQSEDNVIEYFNSLIIINSTTINMNQIIINRGIGVNEFALLNIQNLKITNLTVNLIDQYKIKSLHQHFDCLQDQIYENKYGTMIYVIGGKYSYLENILIQNLIIIDQPLIQFLTLINYVEPQQETIILKNSILKNNILLITQLSKTVSIIFIQSMQFISIYISSADIIQNHFNGYISEQNSISTSTLTINCPSGNLNMDMINLSSNLNTNSTNQIMVIIAQTIYFANSYVSDNNQITVQSILPNLYYGFANNNITLNNNKISKIFPVISYGTFKFSVQRLQIDNVALSRSFGNLGTCFTILTEKLGIIQISNSNFSEISDGGCIYIDSTPANLDLTVNNIIFESIFNSQDGGAISIRPTSYSAKIQIFNVSVLDTYAISGSFLNSQFYSSSQNKIISLDSIEIRDQQSKFFDYLLIFTDFMSSLQELQTNSYIINIKNSNQVNISNIYLQNIKTPRMFNIIEGNMTFFNISLIDTQNVIQGFFIKQSNQLDWLYLELIFIKNQTSFNAQNNLTNCESSLNDNSSIHMICQNNMQLSINIDQEFSNNALILQRECRASIFHNQILNLDSYINIEMTGKSNHTFLNNIICQHNNVSQFSKGLITLKVTEQIILLDHIVFENNICSQYGCLSIINLDTTQTNRLLQTVNQVVEEIPLKIQQMNCISNYAINGTCIYISELSALIKNSNFVQNIAEQYGGAIYIEGKHQIFLIGNYINNNQAQIGGAFYINQGQIDSKILIMNIIDANKGIISNNNAYQYPSQVITQIKLNEMLIASTRLFSNQSFTLDQLDYNQLGTQQYIKMPSGIEIDKYALYNQTNQIYSNSNLCLLIYVADQFSNLMFTSKESQCQVKSRKIFLQQGSLTDVEFQDEKLVSLESVYFDQVKNYYDFGKLNLQFDPDSNVNEVLQLQFQCDSILVAQFNESNKYQTVSYSSHYYYRINIRTLPCQIGEIKNLTTLSCQICDSATGFFQVRYNKSHCLLMDNGVMLNNTSSNFQLRPGYWRQSYQNIILDQCSNNLENCLGGWNYSDSSCLLGHIGALCEECDLYNTRGQGQFSSHKQYTCGTCNTIENNILLWLVVSVWTIVSVGITVKATFDFGYSIRVNRHIMRIALLLANESCSGGILIKFLSTYLQIVGSLSTFQLTLPSLFSSIMNTTANPIQTVIYSLDCLLANVFQLEIVYSRIVWQLMMPLVYIVLFFIGFAIILRDKVILMKNGLIITGMIYIYIFLQPNLIGSIISVIAFRVVDGYRWIQGHMAYRYDTDYHYHFLYFLFGMLFIIGILIPLTLLYKLYQNRNKLNSLLIRNLYGYLYNEYIDKAYFWELVKLGLKDVIIFFLTFYQDYIFLKAVIIYLMLQIYIKLSQHYKPYRLNFLNLLDHEMCLNCQISIIIGLGLSLIQKQQINSAEVPFILILAVINCLFLYKILSKLFEAYLTKFQVYIDQIKDKIKINFPHLKQYKVCQISLQNRTAARKRAKQNFRKLYNVMMTIKGLSNQLKHQHLSTEQ